MKASNNRKVINTNLGDLIAAISDVVFENSNDAKEAYKLAHRVLMEMLKNASLKTAIDDRLYPTNSFLH